MNVVRTTVARLLAIIGVSIAMATSVAAQHLPDSVRTAGITVEEWRLVQDEVRRTAVELQVSEAALQAIAERLGLAFSGRGRRVDVNQIIELIEARGAELRTLLDRLALLERDADSETSRLLRDARSAIDSGNLEAAERTLESARQTARAARAAAQLQEVLVIKAAAELHALRFDFLGAARLYAEAAEIAPDDAAGSQWALRYFQAQALYEHGRTFGDQGALREAVQVGFDQVLPLVPVHQSPDEWAVSQTQIGVALQLLAERGDDEALAASVEAFERALGVLTIERQPLLWAEATHNLGMIWRVAGERGDIESLERSVLAFEQTLRVVRRDQDAASWATVQNSLGLSLFRLAEQGSADALARSIAAFEAALSVRTPTADPSGWAETTNNLANTLLERGAAGDRQALLRSIETFEAALTVATEQRSPATWATMQMNLGRALFAFGTPEALSRSVEAYESALTVRTPAQDPQGWAQTMNNLGLTLLAIGERGDRAALVRSLEIFEAARSVMTVDRDPLGWASATLNGAIALNAQGRGNEARAEAQAALRVFERIQDTQDAQRARDFIRAIQ